MNVRALSLWLTFMMVGTALPRVGHAQPPPLDTRPLEQANVNRTEATRAAEFSVGRLFGAGFVGLLASGAAGYGTYKALCGDELCPAGFVLGSLASLTASTLTVWGTGRAFSGRGTWKATAWGALGAFAVAAPFIAIDPLLSTGIGLTLAPFLGAWTFELSSRSYAQQAPAVRVSALPMVSWVGRPVMGASLTGAF